MKAISIGVVGLVVMLIGAVMHRGGEGLAFQSERLALGLALLGLGVICFARVVQGAEKGA